MIRVTKLEAVCILIEGAMQAFTAGNDVCALVLAGAAEEAMPPTARFTLFQVMKAFGINHHGSERGVVRSLNAERDWLKHHNTEQSEVMDIDGHAMINRALSRFYAVYGRSSETDLMASWWADGDDAPPHEDDE